MSDTYELKIRISRQAYIRLKRIALGQGRPMNRQLERIIDEWPKLTHAPLPPLPHKLTSDQQLDVDLRALEED